MGKSEYSKLLQHPKWQKVKTRVQIRADFKCEHPGCDYPKDQNNNLHVHHTYRLGTKKIYEKGLKPWEYPIESLQLLCKRHHEEVHGRMPKQPAVESEDSLSHKEIVADFGLSVPARKSTAKILQVGGPVGRPRRPRPPPDSREDGLMSTVGLDDPDNLKKIIAEAIIGAEDDNPQPHPGYSGWIKYEYKNGQVFRLLQCKDGNFNGPWIEWYDFLNGQKEMEGNYKGGKRNGLWTWWHDNGQKKTAGSYKNNMQEGLWTWWFWNGQKRYERNYKDGETIKD